MTAYTSAGTTLRVTAAAPATFDSAGFTTLFPATPAAANPVVGEITDLGEFGREYALVTHNPLASRATEKYKGSFNSGGIQIALAYDKADMGQDILRTALLGDANYYFEIKDQQGNKTYFGGKVMSFKEQIGSVDQITTGSVLVEITANSAGVDFVRVEAI